MNKDERIMKLMETVIKQHKGELDRATLMKKVNLTINQYNRIKSHFEERYHNVEYDKSSKRWKVVK